jgi:5-methylcytosine-specific restriction endonuclease McrA
MCHNLLGFVIIEYSLVIKYLKHYHISNDTILYHQCCRCGIVKSPTLDEIISENKFISGVGHHLQADFVRIDSDPNKA